MNLKQMMEAALNEARSIAQKAKDENRPLTDEEITSFDAKMAEFESLKGQLKRAEESDARFKALAGGSRKDGGAVLSFKNLGTQMKSTMDGEFNVKALVTAGSQVVPAATISSPVTMSKPATGLLDILPVKEIEGTDEHRYLAQSVRTNNAAPVAVGALKPTSTYTLVEKTGKLKVIAHMSEPMPEYSLRDSDILAQFLTEEMGYGLQIAVEAQVVTGTGVDPNLLGILGTSGIQSSGFNTSKILSVRSAITKVEALGYTASGIALNPLDWEAIETATASGTGEFLMDPAGSPIDRAARRLWGVPVAVTTAVAQNTGVLLSKLSDDDHAVQIVTDGQINAQFGWVGDDFGRNQVRARVEGRFDVAVKRPLGVVKIALAAA